MSREREMTVQPAAAPAAPGAAAALLPGVASVAGVLALQRTVGNAAVGALLGRAVLQRDVGWARTTSRAATASRESRSSGFSPRRSAHAAAAMTA